MNLESINEVFELGPAGQTAKCYVSVNFLHRMFIYEVLLGVIGIRDI